jgi:SAM-dependent methyltransferase
MYNPKYTKTFYNAYGDAEWARLEATPYGRLQAIIHEDFVLRYLKSGDLVLDAGCGPGRFSIVAARTGARLTCLDISDTQLKTAKEKIQTAGLTDKVDKFIQGDICDLSMFKDGQFDVVICLGAVLSYVCEKKQKAADELKRVTRQGGVILVEVASLMGPVLGIARRPTMPLMQNPEKGLPGLPGIWPVLKTGDLLEFPSQAAKMKHAPMHLYTAEELRMLFKNCEVLETVGSNVTITEYGTTNEQLAGDPKTWETLVELEKKINHDPGLVNTGSHIIMAVRK